MAKQKREFLQIAIKVLKSIFHGHFDSKIDARDGFVISSNRAFLEKNLSELNIKKLKKDDLVHLVELIACKSDSMLLKTLLKYRSKIWKFVADRTVNESSFRKQVILHPLIYRCPWIQQNKYQFFSTKDWILTKISLNWSHMT